MIDVLIRWSLQNRLFVLCGAALVLAWGAWEATRMPVDVFPDLTAPTVTVLCEAHGMAPEEVESLVTFPIEAALNGASHVRRVRSSTSVGFAVVWVELEWGTDILQARQIVSEKLQLVRESLPPEAEAPILAPISSIMGEILFVALVGEEGTDPMALRTEAETVLRRRLLAVPGVSQVIAIGGDERQLQVRLHPDRLGPLNLGPLDVVAALERSNESTSAGFYVEGGQEYLIHGMGRVRRPEDVAATVVAMRGGRPVLVEEVATVRPGAAPKRGEGSHNATPAVIIGIQKQPGANTLKLTGRIDEVLADLEQRLPAGMRIERDIFRQADFIEVAVRNVTHALRDGAGLVVVIVLLFLVSLRATAITVVAIPLSLVVAVLVLQWLGATVNTMTLGGMAIAVGALVDDAIIDVENVVRRLRLNMALPPGERRRSLAVVLDASREVRGSIVFATFVIVLVFLPLFFLSGVEGRLLQPLGLAYAVSLGASLIVAVTVTPAMCSLLLPGSRAVRAARTPLVVRLLERAYGPTLGLVVRRWRSVTLLSLVAFGAALWWLGKAGQSFLPDFAEGTLTLSVVTLPGTSLEESNRIGTQVERILLAHPEIVSTARRTGRAEADEHAQGVNAAEIDVNLKMGERSKEELLAAVRRDLSSVPGTNIVIGQPISHRIDHMLSGTRANLAVKVFGTDLTVLRRLAEQVRAAMEQVPGVVDLSIEQQEDIPILAVRFDRAALASHGLSVSHVAHALEVAYGGLAVSRIVEGRASYDLVVRYEAEARGSIDDVKELLIGTPTGTVPLHALADVRRDRGPSSIGREAVERRIVVMCNVGGRDLRSVADDVERAARSVPMPRGYHVELGGQIESAEAASRTLLAVGGAVVIGVFLLLFVAFGSGRDAAIVMVNLPLALIGGVAGVHVAGGVLSVASIIGFITLFGIATRNGIMLLAHVRHLVEHEGIRDAEEAVRRGAVERVAPILMTALATGLGLVPLALSGGEPGSEIQTPMAIVILLGLGSSTALNMVVLPALALRFGSVRARVRSVQEQS